MTNNIYELLLHEKNKIIEEQDNIIYPFLKNKYKIQEIKKKIFWLSFGIVIGGIGVWIIKI
jgi:hypothetical protein